MTNCRNESAISELHAELPTLVMYRPVEARFAEEGPRLLIEQSIAIQVHI